MDLVIRLDGTSEKTVLVYRALRETIVDGRLPVGERLPPTRCSRRIWGWRGGVWRLRTRGWLRRGI
jgi:DNA-binding FadR family transcriptional regulator